MVPFVIWFVFHVYLIWSPLFRGYSLPASSVWTIPLSFCSGAGLLYGEWYATFFLSNSVFSAIQLLASLALFAAPPEPSDTERAIAGGSRALLRILMSVVTLASTLF